MCNLTTVTCQFRYVVATCKTQAIRFINTGSMSSWGDQFREGDQGWNRTLFWDSSYRICPECKGTDLKHVDHSAGCRHNGDGYGTTVYTCNGCAWSTSFLYDESDSPYYYETRTFTMNPPVYVPPPDKVIGTYIKQHKWEPMRETHSDDDLRVIMLADGYTNATITAFFAEHKRYEPSKRGQPKAKKTT